MRATKNKKNNAFFFHVRCKYVICWFQFIIVSHMEKLGVKLSISIFNSRRKVPAILRNNVT